MGRERRAPRPAWALIALALVFPRAALTTAASSVSLAELARLEARPSPSAPLDLHVNGGFRGTVEVVVREGDALVPVEDLELAGLRGLEGRRETIEGRVYVSLASLAPALRFELDEPGLALRVTAAPELLGRRAIDLRPTARPPGLEPRGDPSGFLNYSVQYRTDDLWSGFLEAGASASGRLLYASGQRLADGSAVRGMSSLTLDDVGALRRVVVGDGFAASTALGGGVLLGGVSLVREYGLDPYLVRSPMPGLSGFAATPSTLDVYVNGVLARQVPVPPGGYDVSNLPVTAGAGDVKAVLRDAFGRTEVLDRRYYYTPGLLSPGLSDYGYAIGFRRIGYGRESFSYGRPVLVGRHRAGLGERLTVGARLDAAADLLSGGPGATIGLPFGTIDLEAAASVEDGAVGGAGSLAYTFSSRRLTAGALVRVLGDRYANAALRPEHDRARVQSTVFAGAPVGPRVHLGLDYSAFDRRDAGFSDTLSARADVRVARGLTLGVSGGRTTSPGAKDAWDLFASLTWAIAPLTVADASVRAGDGGSSVAAGVQRGLPAGTGIGYRARGGTGPSGDAATGLLQAQWDHGRYELEYDRFGETGIGTATVAGGAAVIGGRVFLSRPLQQGYGLIRTGVPDVRGFAEGQEIGRTDARGDLLVPRLLPYYGNRLGIADRDVPIAYRIGDTERLAAPTLRGGVVTRFEVAPLRVVEGRLVAVDAGRELTPAYGELALRAIAPAASSPVGGDGRFWLESVPPGLHVADVEWSGGRCRATLAVPESPALVDLGRVPCHPEPVLVRSPAPRRETAQAEAPGPAPAEALDASAPQAGLRVAGASDIGAASGPAATVPAPAAAPASPDAPPERVPAAAEAPAVVTTAPIATPGSPATVPPATVPPATVPPAAVPPAAGSPVAAEAPARGPAASPSAGAALSGVAHPVLERAPVATASPPPAPVGGGQPVIGAPAGDHRAAQPAQRPPRATSAVPPRPARVQGPPRPAAVLAAPPQPARAAAPAEAPPAAGAAATEPAPGGAAGGDELPRWRIVAAFLAVAVLGGAVGAPIARRILRPAPRKPRSGE